MPSISLWYSAWTADSRAAERERERAAVFIATPVAAGTLQWKASSCIFRQRDCSTRPAGVAKGLAPLAKKVGKSGGHFVRSLPRDEVACVSNPVDLQVGDDLVETGELDR